LVGFAGLLLVMGLLAFASVRQSRDAGVTSALLRQGSRDRDALLDQLRTDFYHSATLLRDYLSEPDDTRAAAQRSQLALLQAQTTAALDRYRDMIPDDEIKDVQNLREHVESYWERLAPALGWNRTARRDLADAFLQNIVIPGRNDLVGLVKQVNDLDKRDLDAGEERIQAVQSTFGARVTTMSVLALALAGILAVIVLRRVQRLETETDDRFHEVVVARSDLRRLSDRLVTAQEEERRNISRELHDDLGQAMSAMLIELGRLESSTSETGAQRERFASVRRMAEDNVAKVRNLALLLRPSMLDELGLVAALRWHAREVTRRTGFKVRMIADELDDDLPESLRTCVFRVVQEALNNCVKHSKALDARVVIRREQDGLSVSIEDNGVGFDPARDRGLGLLGMAERVSHFGGLFHIHSQPSQGTILTIYFPLESSRSTPAEAGAV
jgi:signal transduction histidine kinase